MLPGNKRLRRVTVSGRASHAQVRKGATLIGEVAERWFERVEIDEQITLLYELHANALLRSNLWHVRGQDRSLFIDAGLGVSSLREAHPDLFERDPLLVLTHSHYDHVGGAHEFKERWIHDIEAQFLMQPEFATLDGQDFPAETRRQMAEMGIPVEGALIDALPHKGYDIRSYRVVPAPATRTLRDGDLVHLGDRCFRVLHLPGHSPGSIGLWEEETGILFSGDAVYDGVLIDDLPGSDIGAYITTMQKLRELPVSVVHGGHDSSFGRERMISIVDRYLESTNERRTGTD